MRCGWHVPGEVPRRHQHRRARQVDPRARPEEAVHGDVGRQRAREELCHVPERRAHVPEPRVRRARRPRRRRAEERLWRVEQGFRELDPGVERAHAHGRAVAAGAEHAVVERDAARGGPSQGCLPPILRHEDDGPGEGRLCVHRRRPGRDDEHPEKGGLRGCVPGVALVAVLRHALQLQGVQSHRQRQGR